MVTLITKPRKKGMILLINMVYYLSLQKYGFFGIIDFIFEEKSQMTIKKGKKKACYDSQL